MRVLSFSLVMVAAGACGGDTASGADGGASAAPDGGASGMDAGDPAAGGGDLFSERLAVEVAAPWSLATGDLDADGKPDLLVGHRFSESSVTVLPGRGDGTFGAPAAHGGGNWTGWVAVADLDLDAVPDLALAMTQDAAIETYLGLGGGELGAPATTEVPQGLDPEQLAVADVDNDAVPDLLVANGSSAGDTIAVFLGAGDGTFAEPRELAVGDTSGSIAAADLDRDGRVDIATGSPGLGAVATFFGSGDGEFTAGPTITPANVSAVAAGDMDLDGTPDLVIGGAGNVHVALGEGDGAFAEPVAYPGESSTGKLVVADLDLDGNLDVVVGDRLSQQVHVFRGAGDGTLRPKAALDVGDHPEGLAVTDFDLDGRPDLAIAIAEEDEVAVFLGASR